MDIEVKSREYYPRHSVLTEKCVFLVDFLNQRNQSLPSGFETVETKPKATRSFFRRPYRSNDIVDKKRKERSAIKLGQKQRQEKQKQVHRRNKSRRARLRSRYWSSLKFAQPLTRNRHLKDSLAVDPSWPTMHQFSYTEFVKLSATLREPAETLLRTGKMQHLNPRFVSVRPNRPVNVERSLLGSHLFVHPRSTIDPVLKRFASEGRGNFFLTSKTAAMIMSSNRAVHSFDLKFIKRHGVIFVDHRVPSRATQITTDETMRNGPSVAERDAGHLNSATRLQTERTNLNSIFSQQVLLEETPESPAFEFDDGAPFPFRLRQGPRKPCLKGYVYKRFVLSKEVTVVMRCEIDAVAKDEDETCFVLNRALHQYTHKTSGLWQDLLDASPGNVVLQELNHNSFEFGRWIYEALLSDCRFLNVGYLTRRNLNSDRAHQILMMDQMEVGTVATQLNLRLPNGFGILERIASAVLTCPDGDYALLKIANKQCLHSYQTRVIAPKVVVPTVIAEEVVVEMEEEEASAVAVADSETENVEEEEEVGEV